MEFPRVLIVEPDRDLASMTVVACLEAGLEPKLCRGPSHTEFCPGMHGRSCFRGRDVEAALIGITDPWQARITPLCAVGAPRIVASARGVSRTRREVLEGAEALLDHPYHPDQAARLLSRLTSEREKMP